MTYLLGIDVGTTRTAAAIGRPDARPGETEIVNLGDRSSAVPSVLFIDDDGTLVVGEAAERRAVTKSDHVAREFKRRIGDPTPLVVGGRPWTPEELSARLLRWVVDRVAQREGGHPTRVAVTHPASWGGHKKDLFGRALAAQGIPVTFIAEPQAAALHYAAAERIEPGSTIAVYDFGGGTFDAAVVHKETPRSARGAGIDTGGFTLLGRPEGVDRLGGIDFDEIVFEHVLQGMPEAFDGLDENDPAVLSAVAAIRRECREAKEALSADTEVAIPVFTPAGQGSVRLHRSEFEAAIQPRVEETVEALRQAITSAGLSPERLSAVLLVGGSSRVPLVGQLVSEQLGRPVAVDADPKNAIARGAVLSLMPPVVVAPKIPAPRVGGSARLPVAASAPQFGRAGAAVGAQMSAAGPGQPGGSYGPPGIHDSDPTSLATPPTQRVTGSTGPRGAAGIGAGVLPPPPPPRPSYGGGQAQYEYAPEPRRGGRSPAWLVTVGGAAAAVAVVAAAFLWPSNTPVAPAAGAPLSTAPPAATPEATAEPAATDTPVDDERPRPPRPTSAPSPTRGEPALPPPPAPTTAPPPTSQQPPTRTTTQQPPTSTTEPPVSSSATTPPTSSSAAAPA